MIDQSPINLVDVGANIGDTILLLEANCPHMIGQFCCIEADPEFYTYLNYNLGSLPQGQLVQAMLSSSGRTERGLVRLHGGTASAQGAEQMTAMRLDDVLRDLNLQQLHVLKIDVDGLDGAVLLGAQDTLAQYHPAVFFEWYPMLCQQTSNNWSDHFESLQACGYSRFVWFTKYGFFSHFMEGFDRPSTDMLAELCLRDGDYYDVIALHDSSIISYLSLAELAYARNRKSAH